MAYALAQGKEIRSSRLVVTTRIPVMKESLLKVIEMFKEKDATWRLINLPKLEFSFLGVELSMGRLESQMSHMRLACDVEDIREQFDAGAPEVIVSFVSTERTESILKPASREVIEGFEQAAAEWAEAETTIERDS
jgi:hypothetical protein